MKTPDAIAIQLAGGLGNQLFQYAAGRAASLALDCDLLLDLGFLDAREPSVTPRPYLLGAFRINAAIEPSKSQELAWSQYRQPAFCFDPAFRKISVGTRMIGYFQSELFFKDHSDIIRADLDLSVPTSVEFAAVAAQIDSSPNPVSIHLRCGDFVSDPKTRAFHGACDEQYYAKARRLVEGIAGHRLDYFIFSDDPAAADEVFANLAVRQVVRTSPEKPWEDLILMSRCRHHILANSSFSWWGSWLNPRQDKIIVGPRFWFVRETMRTLNTADLHLDGTILI